MKTTIRYRWLAIPLLMLSPTTALSQPPSVDSIHHRNNCRLAIQTLTSGQPPARFDWAASYAEHCGAAGGRALANVLLDSQYVRPEDLGFIVFNAGRVIDRSLFEAALQVAADEARTPGVRVQAIRVIHQQLDAGTVVDFATYASDNDSTFVVMTEAGQEVLQPLLLGSTDAAVAVLAKIEESPGLDPAVRNASERARRHFEAMIRIRHRCAADPSHFMCQPR